MCPWTSPSTMIMHQNGALCPRCCSLVPSWEVGDASFAKDIWCVQQAVPFLWLWVTYPEIPNPQEAEVASLGS